MDPLVGIFGLVALAVLIGTLFRFLGKPTETEAAAMAPTQTGDASRLLEYGSKLYEFFNACGKPSDLLENDDFHAGVAYLNSSGYSTGDLLGYYSGDNAVLACLALEALARRDDNDDVREPILQGINSVAYWTRYYALRRLNRQTPAEESLVGPILAKIDGSWGHPTALAFLKEFVAARIAGGERPSFDSSLEEMTNEQAQFLQQFLPRLGASESATLLAELQQWQTERIDVAFLKTLGQVWDAASEHAADAPIEHDRLIGQVVAVEDALARTPRRSTLLVGDEGVGKSAIVGVAGRRLQKAGWTIFEAGHTELMAGMIYHGQFEERLRDLVQQLGGGRRILWVLPDFHSLTVTGRHQYGPSSALDYLLPYIESGEIAVLAETSPTSYDKQLKSKPRSRTAMEVRRVAPLPEEETLKLAELWVDRHRLPEDRELIDARTLNEAWNLTRQYLWSKATPGNLLDFLSLTRRALATADPAQARAIQVDDLILTLSRLTGLPDSILDERQGLDLEALRQLFQRKVMGQGEAVDCLVERVAMIKAGVTDPTRPQGVFLFAGPTGTGKTEIAKTLTEFLFGTPERMIRLDMSEFQEPTSMDRILGDPQEPRGDALVELIRKQPFSVVLLDEFEKAHSNIWDLFLQVFDDGRLTDRWGSTADFRHAIIIVTSNLGGAIPGGTSLGFTEGGGKFSGVLVHRALDKTFRREFLNRIDRIVIFRPLGRDVMRAILRRELDDVFQRRGLRNRAWAVEWDDSALEFLLARGFTADLGARPLKRAIERYLLAPLATTIVNHQFPEGDQFLFVRARGPELTVEFIDPNAPEPEPDEAPPTRIPVDLSVEGAVLSPHGTADEVGLLRAEYDRLRAAVEGDAFKDKKHAALAMTSSPGFWSSPGRFKVLGHAEYLDRIESGLRTAGSLVERLVGLAERKGSFVPRHLISRLAQQLYLIGLASDDTEHSGEAFLLIEAGHGGGSAGLASNDFALRLGRMYRKWADKRGMRFEILEESDGEPYRLLCAVSGYAARSILAPEEGLHIFEVPEPGGRSFKRRAARIRVVRQPAEPAAGGELCRQAKRALDASSTDRLRIVRRYREEPSPLVRDSVRGWRTGRVDRVLDGDFDLVTGKKRAEQPAE
jgi:ATP-dependent Clp protease ATP-binding subunit ClpC